MKKSTIYLLLLFSMVVVSCGFFDYSYYKKIGDNYFIRSVEQRERMNIGFGTEEISEGLIANTVFEVHWDQTYILAKRHPITSRGTTEYYIVKKVKFGGSNPSEYMYGPFTRGKYEIKLKELNLDTTKMESIVFEDLK